MSAPALVHGPAAEAAGPLPDTGPRVGAVSGSPMTRTLCWHEAADGAPAVGVWECTPGVWDVEGAAASETIVITAGRGRLTDAGGRSVDVGPGDTVLLPRGWHGRWEVVETLRKIYVVS